MAALVSKDSEGIYTALACPDQDVYSTLRQTSLNSPGAQNTEHRGQSSNTYRRVAVCLGLLCALLLAVTVVLCVLYISLLRSNYSTMNTEKVQLQSNVSNRCPQGWAQFSSKCYYFSNVTKSWEDSRSDCEEWGADLVIIESEKEQRFINKKQIEGYSWIGLSYSAAKGNWLWVNGTPLQQGFWESGEPDVKNRFHCALIGHTLNARDAFYCSNKQNFICETNALLS